MKRILCTAALTAFLGIQLCGCSSMYEQAVSSNERADAEDYYELAEGEAAVFLNSERLEGQAICQEDRIYIALDQVRQGLDKHFYWDGKSDDFLFTDASGIRREAVSDEELALVRDDQLYLSTECLDRYLDAQISVFSDPGRVFIDTAGSMQEKASLKSNEKLRVKGGIKSAILADAGKGSELIILETYENWAHVRTEDGYTGYVRLSGIDMDQAREVEVEASEAEAAAADYQQNSLGKPVCLAWHMLTNYTANSYFEELTAKAEGVNVISPTWYSISDNEGNYTDYSSTDYIRQAHEKGMQVWALVDDFNPDISIEAVLGDDRIRQSLAENLVWDAAEMGIDGINVDFEHITDSCGYSYLQFLRELYIHCHEKGMILSVDDMNPTYLRSCYNLEEQGKIADYVILMQYDEHYSGSEPGSVASLPYVQKGLEAAAGLVPAEKLVSGLPFYTRIWTETPAEYAEEGAQIFEEGDSLYDRYAVSSRAVPMGDAADYAAKAGAVPVWDQELGQYYAEIPLDYGTERIWLEELESLEEKLKAGQSYDIAGYAFWRIGMETSDVWPLIRQYIGS